MRLAFDTSVLVPALVAAHPAHGRAIVWVDEAVTGRIDAECTWHAVAETFSVLTRIPLDPPISPAMAEVAIDRLLEYMQTVEIDGETYLCALRRCAQRNLRSGAVFDALHLVSAEIRSADGLVTFNAGDFERLRDESSPPIVVPPEPPRFTPPGR